MARKITRKELKQDEFVDAAVDFGKWLEDNWPKLLRWVGAIAAIAAVLLAWTAYSRHNRAQAEMRLSSVLADYDRVESAGFTDAAELETIIGELDAVAGSAGGISAAVARLYLGAAYFQQERYDDAEAELRQAISKSRQGDTVYTTASVLLASVIEAGGRADEAVNLLDGLVDGPETALPKDQALLQTGMIYQRAGRLEEARDRWERVTSEYPNSMGAGEARRRLTP